MLSHFETSLPSVDIGGQSQETYCKNLGLSSLIWLLGYEHLVMNVHKGIMGVIQSEGKATIRKSSLAEQIHFALHCCILQPCMMRKEYGRLGWEHVKKGILLTFCS